MPQNKSHNIHELLGGSVLEVGYLLAFPIEYSWLLYFEFILCFLCPCVLVLFNYLFISLITLEYTLVSVETELMHGFITVFN